MTILRKLALLPLALALTATAAAQQRPHYSQYMMNNYILNPSITGIEDYLDVKASSRMQWTGIEGAPQTFYLTAHSSLGPPVRRRSSGLPIRSKGSSRAGSQPGRRDTQLRNKPVHGIGMMAVADKAGPLSVLGAHVSYAYHQPLPHKMYVSAGVSLGGIQYSLNPNLLHLASPGDRIIPGGPTVLTLPDMALGASLYSQTFYVGFAANQVLGNRLFFNRNYLTVEGREHPHFFLSGAYKLAASEGISLIPSVLVKVVRPVPVSVDVNLKALFHDRAWTAVSYRHRDAVVAMAGFNVNYLLDVGYSYDFTTSTLNRVSFGSHEVMVGLRINNKNKVVCANAFW